MKNTTLIRRLPIFLSAVLAATMAAAEPMRFRISLNTGPNHVRNIALEKFIATLRERAGDKLDVQLFPSGQLFKGPDVPKALAQGSLEMGVPIVLYVSRLVPNAGVGDLPMFYGRNIDEIHAVFDGPAGAKLNDEIEKKLRVKVVGPYLDLGFGSIFTTKTEVEKIADLAGLKLRVPGSVGGKKRYDLADATAVAIPFADVPLALAQGTVDGLMTTHETIRSAKLWESGLKYAFDDQQVFLQYLPMIGRPAWDKMDAETRQLIVNTWADTIGDARALAAQRQAEARAEGIKNGIRAATGTPADLKQFREKLMRGQDDIIKETGIDPGFVREVAAALGN